MDINAKLKERLLIFEEIDRLANKSENLIFLLFNSLKLYFIRFGEDYFHEYILLIQN